MSVIYSAFIGDPSLAHCTSFHFTKSKRANIVVAQHLTDICDRGNPGDEVEDIRPNMTHTRRRSNSSTHVLDDFKTKFETIEIEPVFEEELHGPMGDELEKQSTTSTDKSVDEEEHNSKH